MAVDLKRFQALTRVFDPIYRPQAGASLVGRGAYVADAHGQYRQQLEAALALNDHAKLLAAGQPGCGKTTMLQSIAQSLVDEGRVAVFVDLEVHAALQDLGLQELHLAASMELLALIEEGGATVSEGALGQAANLLHRMVGGDPGAGLLSERFRGVLRGAHDDPEQRRVLRNLVAADPASTPAALLARLLKELAAHRPVVILDGLDKLPPDQARDFFLRDSKPMVDLPGAAVLTIPLSLVYESSFNVLSERYNNADSAVLPAIRLYEFDGDARRRVRFEAGFDVLRRIVTARAEPIDARAIMPDAVDRAIEGSGGNIRELARLLQASIVKAYVRRGEFVESQDVEAAIADQRESFRRTLQPRFVPVLKRVRDAFQLDNVDDIGKLLLYGLWVMEYRNGITWYALPVPVEQLLAQIERSPSHGG
jgi:hypothetical protein